MLWMDAKMQVLSRGPVSCPFCGRVATDAHHALVHRNKRFAEWVNHPINLDMLCHECHLQGMGDTLEYRRTFYVKQCNRYGYERVQEWLDAMPPKMRLTHRLDFK